MQTRELKRNVIKIIIICRTKLFSPLLAISAHTKFNKLEKETPRDHQPWSRFDFSSVPILYLIPLRGEKTSRRVPCGVGTYEVSCGVTCMSTAWHSLCVVSLLACSVHAGKCRDVDTFPSHSTSSGIRHSSEILNLLQLKFNYLTGVCWIWFVADGKIENVSKKKKKKGSASEAQMTFLKSIWDIRQSPDPSNSHFVFFWWRQK